MKRQQGENNMKITDDLLIELEDELEHTYIRLNVEEYVMSCPLYILIWEGVDDNYLDLQIEFIGYEEGAELKYWEVTEELKSWEEWYPMFVSTLNTEGWKYKIERGKITASKSIDVSSYESKEEILKTIRESIKKLSADLI